MNGMATTRMLLTTAVLAAVAALVAAPAQAYLDDAGGGGGTTAVTAPAPLGLTGDSALTRVVPAADVLDPAIRTAIAAHSSGSSLGLTGDSAATRGEMPLVLTTPVSSPGSDVDWTWLGLVAAFSALLAAGTATIVVSSRSRGRVALP